MRTLVGVASFAVLIAVATPAYADPSGDATGADGTFLASLKKEGVSLKSEPGAISVGKKACKLMDQGHSESQVIDSLSADNPGFPPDSATKFTTIAVSAYCPAHNDEPNAAPPPSPTPAPAPAQQVPPPGAP